MELSMKKNQRGEMQGEMQRSNGGGQLNVTLGLELENILFIFVFFFLSAGLVESIRLGSIDFRL